FYGPFSFVDELRRDKDGNIVSGEDRDAAFDVVDEEGHANPIYRRHTKHDVDMIKGIAAHIWQSALVAKDLGDSKPISDHEIDASDESVSAGRVIFATNCLSCHSIEPDLVEGTGIVPFIDLAGEIVNDELPLVYKQVTELMAAPKYAYSIDGQVVRDGHGNPMTNEFIYSIAANLSRIGEKADADYLVEWVLQPRLRNKHSIMPSFWPALSGTPEGMDRDALNETIAAFEAKDVASLSLDDQLLYFNAKRERGDIDAASIQGYRSAVRAYALAQPIMENASENEANVDFGANTNSASIVRRLREALQSYDQARKVVAYLTTLKIDKTLRKGMEDKTSGYIGDYKYNARVG
ncbi:MAG: c-type cytochrome, partial [Planctomycetes bacterium]|nr:c-type cytochrome [Planctomycetota bacterium]